MAIQRYCEDSERIILDTTLADTPEIPFGGAAGGTMYIPTLRTDGTTTQTVASLTFWVSDSKAGTFLPLQDKNNVAVTLTVGITKAYPFPDECFGARSIKIIPDVDADEIIYTLKS